MCNLLISFIAISCLDITFVYLIPKKGIVDQACKYVFNNKFILHGVIVLGS